MKVLRSSCELPSHLIEEVLQSCTSFLHIVFAIVLHPVLADDIAVSLEQNSRSAQCGLQVVRYHHDALTVLMYFREYIENVFT